MLKLEEKLKEKYDIDRCQWEKESFYSLIWRRLSLPITFLLAKTRISANQVSILSLVFGILAAFSYSYGTPDYLILGSFLLFVYQLLDNVDGEIARLKKQTSVKGRLYDNYTGVIKDCFLIFGLTIGFSRQMESINIFYLEENIPTWYLGFSILILWFLPSKLYSEMRALMGKEGFDNLKKKSIKPFAGRVDERIGFVKSPTKLYSVLISGLIRGNVIMILAAINQLPLLFAFLICAGFIRTTVNSYVLLSRL